MFTFEMKDGVTLALGTVGAVLGIINTWHSLNQKRVRLRVVPKYAIFAGDGVYQSTKPTGGLGAQVDERGCIEVTNLSEFPINVSEIGFTIAGVSRNKERLVIKHPKTTDGHQFFRRLASRESVTGYFELIDLSPNIEKAYVGTECGEVEYGTSPALREIIGRLRITHRVDT